MPSLRLWMMLLGLVWIGAAQAEEPPQPGSLAPGFVLADAEGKDWQLADMRGKWVVLYFYPKDDTAGCTLEAANFRDRLPEFERLGAHVVGVSLDDGESHRAFAEKQRLSFPLLVDAGGRVARRYGALTSLGFIKFAKRYTFLIDPEGIVAQRYLQVEPERHADQLLADLKMLGARYAERREATEVR